MMPRKAVQYSFAVFAMLAALASPCRALAATESGPQNQPGASAADSLRQTEAKKASSSQWRSNIWDAYPADRLSGSQSDPVSAAYQQNEWKPFFIDCRFEVNEAGKLVMKRLDSLENEAIDPKPYNLEAIAKAAQKLNQCRAILQSADPGAVDTKADALLAQPAQSASSPQRSAVPGNNPSKSAAPAVDPAQVRDRLLKYQDTFKAAAELDVVLAAAFARFSKEMRPASEETQVKTLLGEVPMAKTLKDFEPDHYQTLVASYAQYRALAARGQQQHYAHSSTVRHGESGNHIRDLQKRLQQEGFYSGHINGVFDSETQRAVKSFQATHLIEADGAVGQRTREWLNVPFREKADMIAYAMKSLRQSSVRTNERFIRINIPQFQLEYYKAGKVEVTHRVVVGKAGGKKVKFRGKLIGENQTPTLTSSIEQVILNPRWYVSDRIRMELDAEAKSDPEWFSRHGYVQMASLHSWGQPRIFQRPGPNNALGRVKFEFPNIYAVYLHDTPKKHLFSRVRRDFSHGCIRVDKAIELAQTLLSDDKSPYAPKVGSILNGQAQTFVKLSQPVPIAIEYIPVSTNGNGQVLFLGDPYGVLRDSGNQKG